MKTVKEYEQLLGYLQSQVSIDKYLKKFEKIKDLRMILTYYQNTSQFLRFNELIDVEGVIISGLYFRNTNRNDICDPFEVFMVIDNHYHNIPNSISFLEKLNQIVKEEVTNK